MCSSDLWGVSGALRPVAYPPGWPTVAAIINAEPHPVAVLPADPMRRFDWAGPAPVLDPLPRWVRAEVLSTGDLRVSGRTVPGEGVHARAVQQLLEAGADPAELARAGVGWVVVETGEPGAAAAALTQLAPAYQDDELTLYRVGGDAPGAPPGHRRAVIAAHVLWLTVLAGGAAGLTVGWWRRRGSGVARGPLNG